MPARERLEIVARPTKVRPVEREPGLVGAAKFEARRDEIARAAIEPLNRNGLRGMTLSDVAARLELAPTAVGYYFKRKEDLAAACYQASIAKLDGFVTEAIAHGSNPLQAFIRIFFEFRRRTDAGQEDEIAWFEDVRTIQHPEVDQAYIHFFRRLRDLFGPISSRAQRVECNVRAHMLMSQLYWAIGWLPQYHLHDYARMAERVIDIFENGMAAQGQPWPTAFPDMINSETGEDPRGQFLRAATELINERGYLGASVQKISERLNMTKGAFYHRHDAKNDLVAQCFERTWRVVAEAQAVADAQTDSGLANLASVAFVLSRRQLMNETVILRSAALAAVPAELRPELIYGFTRTASRFTSVFCDGIADGSIRPMEVEVAARMVSHAINAAAELHFWSSDTPPAQAADLFIRPLFMGLFTQPLEDA